MVENCNYRCQHCYIKYSFRENQKEPSLLELTELFEQFKAYGVTSVSLTGGEPLLREDIIEIIAAAKKNNLYCCLKTNGYFLNSTLIKKLEKLELDEIILSVYGMNNEEYTQVTGFKADGNLFDRFKENVELLVRTKIRTELRYVLLKQNYKSYSEFVKWCSSLEFDNEQRAFILDIYPDNNCDDLVTKSALDEKEISEFLKILYENDKSTFDSIYYQNYEYKQCLVGRQLIHIKCSGDVYPCPNFPIIVGNIWQESFKSIWEESELLNEIRMIKSNEIECVDCEEKNQCYQRCLGAMYVWNNQKSYKTCNSNYCARKKIMANLIQQLRGDNKC